jgi:hypothetical protein
MFCEAPFCDIPFTSFYEIFANGEVFYFDVEIQQLIGFTFDIQQTGVFLLDIQQQQDIEVVR